MFQLLEIAQIKTMPAVGKKHFPYTEEGKEKAEKFAKKTGKKLVSKKGSKKK